jgi:TRAP-type C4-dicarboxylate transport system substrate-binding protein
MNRWLCVIWLILIGAAARSGATVLIYASPYGPKHTFSLADITWMHWVEQHSGGKLQIRPIWSGALISSDQSMIELRHGVADIGLITPIYARGGAHLLREQTAFYRGAKTPEQQVAMYRCLAAATPAFAQELAGLKVLAVQGGTLPGILTRTREVRTLGDLRGLRLRVPTELLRVMRDLGADPVSMPMGEVYSSLAKGVLDGVVAPADALRSMHFGEVAKHYTELEVPRGAYPARAISERRWASLAAQDREVLSASTPVWEAALARETRAAVQAGIAEGRAHGVLFVPIATGEQKLFDAMYDRDAEEGANALARLGIDGAGVYRYARRIADGIRLSGEVACTDGSHAAT